MGQHDQAAGTGELGKGTYRPLLAPVNFLQSKPGTQNFTIWYSGPLSIRNERGRFEFIPSNLQRFTPFPMAPARTVPANPGLPDHLRDVQFTVNGQFQPVLKSKAGQTEIWVLANVSDVVYMPVQLTETATGNHPKIAIVGQDGVPYPEVHHPVFENGTRLLIPPASRYAIAVTMPADGDLILEMPPRGGGASTISAPGVLYTNDGTENPPAVLGSLSVLPEAVSYYDGFFVSPTQILARATTAAGQGVTTAFKEGQKLDAYTVFEDISQLKPDVERELLISGGFLDNLASTSDAKAFMYVFEGIGFPNAPLLQPRLGSVEEWKFLNNNNDEHPIHIHVNDFQVTYYLDPDRGLETGPEMWAVDNANVPAPVLGAGGIRHPAGRAQPAHEVRRFHRAVRDALPSPQPRGQRADDVGQCHPRRLDLCGGRPRIAGTRLAGQDLRRQWRPAGRHGHTFLGFRGDAERGHGRC